VNLILGIVLIVCGFSMVIKDVWDTALVDVDRLKLELKVSEDSRRDIFSALNNAGKWYMNGKIEDKFEYRNIISPAKPESTKCNLCGKSFLEAVKK